MLILTKDGSDSLATKRPNLFSGLTSHEKKVVLQSAERRKIPAKRVIFNSGEPASALFLLMKGTARYYRLTRKGEEVLLWWLVAGDAFGIGTLLTPKVRYIATAESVDDCELLVWKSRKIRQLAATYGLLGENALHIVLHYLSVYADRLVGLTTETAEQRLARTVIHLVERTDHLRPGQLVVEIKNEDLAGLAGVTPFTASRQLQKWEREGVIEKSRGRLRILCPEGLLRD